jgi:hypothetical protein
MLKLSARPRPLVLLSAALLTLPLVAAVQEVGEGTLVNLGKILKRYLEVDAPQKDKDKAKDELIKTLENIGKKRVEGEKKEGAELQAALALTADLGRAVAYSREYNNVAGGKASNEVIDSGNKSKDNTAPKQEYALWVPKTYKPTTPTPLILCVPGVDGGKATRPSEFLQKYWIENDVRDKALFAVVGMPDATATWAQLDGGIGAVMLSLFDVTSRFNVDRDRVYLLGRGEGVAVAVALGSMYPQRFAAIVGTAGDAGKTDPANFQNLPTYFQGAGGDATAFEAKNKELGYNNCTLNAAAAVPDMWSWMQSHPRVANPAKVTLVPGVPAPSKAYWIGIQPTEGKDLSISAEADRATNTITIKATGVPSVQVFLNDVLVDLSKPIKVVLNGHEQQDVIPRSIEDFLDLLQRGTSDAGMVYVARKAYDLPK